MKTAVSCRRTRPGQSPELLEFLQFLESGQYDLLACLLYFSGQEDFIEDRIDLNIDERLIGERMMIWSHLIEVENQIKFANVVKEGIWTRM